jgi:drug/metabolite transporter (DMT)-like permease
MGTAFAVILFNKLIQITSAVYASSVTYLIPIVAILWGVLDNESLFFTHYIGISFILFGVYLVNKK